MVQLAQRKLPAVPVGGQVHVVRRRRAVGRRLAGLRSRGLRGSALSGLRVRVLGFSKSRAALRQGRAAERTTGRSKACAVAGLVEVTLAAESASQLSPYHSNRQV